MLNEVLENNKFCTCSKSLTNGVVGSWANSCVADRRNFVVTAFVTFAKKSANSDFLFPRGVV